ncbi:clostripain-related cysteine peptidase [Labilibaculum sp. K2S]|uniref:clostripain-related cysteine peptidase n=1 Tax=Labilibaculum sp. K2S TaxID=3056386 RepID=UPI0025A33E92|nr:clostripain-related cysteine peptidase [Labilibaculum sp. K2S]
MKLNYYGTFFFVVISTFFSCERKYQEPISLKGRQVLVYMIADNNLDYFAINDINEMERGMANSGNEKGEILVFIDRGENGSPSHPYLMRIVADTTQQVVSTIIRTYPEQNTADPQTLSQVLKDIEELTDVPYQSKGLVLWSHGNAWLPPEVSLYSDRDKILDTTAVKNSRLKSFGLDQEIANSSAYKEMDVIEMANVLNPYSFDFIMFDACFMGSIEVVYELKDVCNYIISSPTEILSAGFPYHQIIPELFSNNFDATLVASKKHEYYENQKGILSSSSVSVVKTQNLQELASFFKHNLSEILLNTNITNEDVPYFKGNIQQYDRLKSEFLFDMYDFVERVCIYKEDTALLNDFKNIWKNTIIYSEHTPFMIGILSLENCNGVSMYLPQDYDTRININAYYKQLKWYEESQRESIFNSF